MRIANVGGRLQLMTTATAGVDVEKASGGQFSADPSAVYDRWDEFAQWASGLGEQADAVEFAPEEFGAPIPFPKQIFALGLNFRDHAEETGLAIPEEIQVFTKWASAFAGPIAEVKLVEGDLIDWEVELVVVIGKGGRDIAEGDAWGHVAGLTMGQDISARRHQGRGTRQFSLAKSYRNYAPMGPVVVTPDEFADKDDIKLGSSVDDEVMQNGRTGDMIFPVSRAIADLSKIVELYPGDVIWTGTPAGVGQGRKRYLRAGERLDSWIDGIGRMSQTFTA